MTALVIVAYWFVALLFVVGLCRAAGLADEDIERWIDETRWM